MNEILLYGFLFDFSAELFINALHDAKGGEVEVRVNSDGGDPYATYGMIAKFKEHPGKKLVKIDGKARSMGVYFAAAADDVEALNVSDILIHRASFPRFFENDPEMFTEQERSRLVKINLDLRAILESAVDVPKFEKISGVTMDELFSLETLIDVSLAAEEAKEVGLVDRVVNITDDISKEIEARSVKYAIAAYKIDVKEPVAPAAPQPKPINTPNNKKTMTLEDLKASHPDVYAQAVQEGSTAGIKAENDRINAFMVFVDIDPKDVTPREILGKQSTDERAESEKDSAEADVESHGFAPLMRWERRKNNSSRSGDEEGSTYSLKRP